MALNIPVMITIGAGCLVVALAMMIDKLFYLDIASVAQAKYSWHSVSY
jgi:hypothetical protein